MAVFMDLPGRRGTCQSLASVCGWLLVAILVGPLRGQEPVVVSPGPAEPDFRSSPIAAEGLIENGGEPGASEADRAGLYSDGTSKMMPRGSGAAPLALADVIASVYRSYPEIIQARQEATRTGGELLGAYGSYDTKLEGYTLSEPTGFYENYRHGIGLARQTWWGGYVSAGYRLGRGVFQPWYLERETEQGGEFKLGWNQPLLQGRAIDPQRLAVFRAALARRAAVPYFQQAILDTSREAAVVYWQWVAAYSLLEARRELLELAETRGEQYEIGLRAGKFAEVDVILNEQLIAERRATAIASEQKLREIGFKLSLFLRDENGQPLVPRDDWVPSRFPVIIPPQVEELESEISAALARRPEPRQLQLELRQLQYDRQLARNQTLPRVDFVAQGSQDVGQPGTSSDDKGEFVLVIGLEGEVPIQRRKARGKLTATSAKIVQVSEKLRLQRDKIAAEVRTAYNALELYADVVEQAETSLRAAFDTLERFRFAFERGNIDLIYLNLLEVKAYETELKLIEAQQEWFTALIRLQMALGLDPLEQAIRVSELPRSDRPGPGRPPQGASVSEEELEEDWQLRAAPMNEDDEQD